MQRILRRISPLVAMCGVLSLACPVWCDEPTLAEVQYDPSEVPAPGTSSRLLLTGALLTAGWYGVAVGTSYLWKDAPNARRLRVPVVGPYAALGKVGCGSGEEGCTTVSVVLRTSLLVFSAVGQTGGVLAALESLFIPTSVDASAGQSGNDRAPTSRINWHPQPLILDVAAAGMSLAGTF